MQSYEYQTMRAFEDSYWWYTGLRARVVDSLARTADTGKKIRVLDAGCGTGGMMHSMHLHFPAAGIVGVDLSSQAVQSTHERKVGPVAHASVAAVPFREETFDIIISLDVVLEMKAVDDHRALSEFHRVLKKQGLLILNLTAFECLRGQHDDAVTVKHRYIKKTLEPLLVNAGFTIVQMTYWNALFFPLLVIWRPLSRLFADTAKPISDLRPLPGWINSVLTGIVLGEIQFSHHMPLPFGSSIFAVAKKK
jgi:ubiquinone/menaquinone biosynthesis C-methylase UbiE